MKKILTLLIALCFVMTVSVPALAEESVNTTVTNEIQTRASESYGSKVLNSGASYYFSSHVLTSGKTVSISYTLNKAGAMQVYFHNSTTGNNIYIKTTYGSTGSASYTASSRCSGYFYLKNASGTTITVNSATLYY